MARRGSRIDFVGYQFTHECTLLRKSIKQNFARKLHGVKSRKRRREILASYWGWAKHGDCKNLWRTLTNNNDMGFSEKGIKPRSRSSDGKKFFDVNDVKLMDILNVPVKVLDFESDVKTKQGNGRYCVLIEIDGKKAKFITNSFNMKDMLDQAREMEAQGKQVFPVENVIIRRKSLGDGKSAYYFEE